jgi:D-sedoheptulose 7-phosphate isomerase
MQNIVFQALEESIQVKGHFIKQNADTLISLARCVAECFASNHKLLLFGNGGSAADAQHIAAEFVNRFAVERRPLPAMALTTDTSVMTSISNDYSFDDIFSKQIEALGQKDDMALAISTSGNSRNVILAVETARQLGLYTVSLTGAGGGELGRCCDLALIVESKSTPRIQESHALAGHLLCELVERILFPESFGNARTK